MSDHTPEKDTGASHAPVSETKSSLPAPLMFAVAIGSGVLGYFISRRLFKQSQMAALTQGYALAASTAGLLGITGHSEGSHNSNHSLFGQAL